MALLWANSWRVDDYRELVICITLALIEYLQVENRCDDAISVMIRFQLLAVTHSHHAQLAVSESSRLTQLHSVSLLCSAF